MKSDVAPDICESPHLEASSWPAWLAHSSPDELLLGKSEGPPRKNRGHNQEQTFSRGRSDVLKHLSSSQTVVNHPCWMWCKCQHSIPNISGFGELRILTILRLFATTSFYLSKAILRFPLISILPLCCSWQCSADRWFSLLQTNYLAPEQRGWLVTPKKTPTKTLNLNIGG